MHYWNRFLNLLTICRKAGKLLPGFDSAKDAANAGLAYCVLYTADVSEKTRKEVQFFADRAKIPAVYIGISMTDVQNAIGRKSGVLAVCESGFAQRLNALATEAVQAQQQAQSNPTAEQSGDIEAM